MSTISSDEQERTPIAISFRTLRDFGDGSFGITLDRNALDVLGLVDESGELVEDGLQAHMVAYSDGRLTVDIPLPEELEDSGPDIPRLRNQRS